MKTQLKKNFLSPAKQNLEGLMRFQSPKMDKVSNRVLNFTPTNKGLQLGSDRQFDN
jgi:hypothetical protein